MTDGRLSDLLAANGTVLNGAPCLHAPRRAGAAPSVVQRRRSRGVVAASLNEIEED